jgi:hypothetical protein
MNEITCIVRPSEASRTLPELAGIAHSEHQEIERLEGEALDRALRAGRALNEAKRQVGHGKWMDWLRDNVTFRKSAAAEYMRLDRERDRLANFRRAGNLSIRQAIAHLDALEGKPKVEADDSEKSSPRTSVPMPAFRPGYSYVAHTNEPIRILIPTLYSVEIVPCAEHPGYWRHAILFLSLRDDEEGSYEGYHEFNHTGFPLNDPVIWADIAAKFPTVTEWQEKAPGYVPFCRDISEEGARRNWRMELWGCPEPDGRHRNPGRGSGPGTAS